MSSMKTTGSPGSAITPPRAIPTAADIDPGRYYTAVQAWPYVRDAIGRNALYALLRRGAIPHKRAGYHYKILGSELLAWYHRADGQPLAASA